MNIIDNLTNIKTADMIGLFVLMLILAAVFLLAVSDDRKKRNSDKLRQSSAMERKKRERKKKRERFAGAAVNVLAKIPLVKRRIVRLQALYRGICPYDEQMLSYKTIATIEKAFLVSAVSVTAVFGVNYMWLGRLELSTVCLSVLSVYVSWTEVTAMDLNAARRTVTDNLSAYFVNVKHAFSCNRNMRNSVIMAADGLPYEIRLHSRQIYDVLSSSDAASKVNSYVTDRKNNRYLRLFVGQAYQAMERGNVRENGESVFSKNLEVLREEMLNSSYDAINRRFIFSGWALVALSPAFALNWFKVKGIEFEETLRSFYLQYGPFIVALGLLATVLVYRLINRTRDIYERIDDFDDGHVYRRIGERIKADSLVKSVPGKYRAGVETMLKRTGSNIPVRVFYMKMFIWSVIGVVVVSSLIVYVHAVEKREYITEIHNFETRISALQKQRPNIEKVLLQIVNEYKDADMETVSDDELLLEIESRIRLPNKDLKASMITVIREQIEGYQTEGIKWYDTLIAMTGLLAGLYWYVELAYYDGECMNARKQEVREFQLVIVLEKSFKTATVYMILSEMASHAILYKDKLQKALLMYSESRERAYEYLRDDDSQPFRNLVDGLQAVDTIGVHEAFAEVESNIRADQRIEKLLDDMAFSKRKETLEIFIYVPAVIFIGVYFILPFLLSSLEGVNAVFNEMGSM